MLYFLLGLFVGGVFGVGIMCMLQINRSEDMEKQSSDAEFEKRVSSGVDNPGKKA